MSYQTQSHNSVPTETPSRQLSLHANHFNDKILEQLNMNQHISSPLSLYALMLLVTLGSVDKTFIEMFNLLTKGTKDLRLIASLSEDIKTQMIHFDRSNSMTTNIKMVNNFYLSNTLISLINTKYTDLISNFGNVDLVNFNNLTSVANTVNSFVNKETNGLIQEIITTDDMTPETLLMLVNVIYFKSSWVNSFNKNHTDDNISFTSLNGNSKVSMMYQKNDFQYYGNDNYQVLTMPYRDGLFVMDVVLPRQSTNNSLSDITAEFTLDMIKHQRNTECDLHFPKFEQRTRLNDLVDTLKTMGVTRIFDFYTSQLDNITELPLIVDQIIHEAVIIVDEEGTEAAAVTITLMRNSCVSINQVEPVVFRADHTFRYFIRYVPNDLILFSGQYDGQ
jgi:serine protease inhibitor